jgi:hypothetical protein
MNLENSKVFNMHVDIVYVYMHNNNIIYGFRNTKMTYNLEWIGWSITLKLINNVMKHIVQYTQ